MIQLSKLVKLTKGLVNILIVFLFVAYVYGTYGFIQSFRGKNSRPIDEYTVPLFWNFLFIAITIILIFK